MYGQQVMCWAAKLGTQDGTFFGFIGGSVDQIDIARMDCLMKFISDCQSPFYIEVVYFRSWRCPKFRPFSDFPSVNFSWTEIRRFPALKVVLIGAVIALIIWIGLDAPTTFPLVPIGSHWVHGDSQPKRVTAVMGPKFASGLWNPFVSGSWHTKRY